MDYATETPDLYNVVFMKVMNKETWQSLPKDLQEILQEVSEEYALKYGKLRAQYTLEGLEYAKQEHGLQEINLDPAEEKRWLERIQPVVEEWIQNKEKKGLPAREVVEIVHELDAKYSKKYARE